MEIIRANVARTQKGDKILVLDDQQEYLTLADMEKQADLIFKLLFDSLPNETWCALVRKIVKEFNNQGYRK